MSNEKRNALELWNVMNTQKNALVSEVTNLENLMLLVEIRNNLKESDKLFINKID